LARARQRLGRRLARLGLGPNSLALAPAAVPRALTLATARSAAVLSGRSNGVVRESVLLLVKGGLQSMVVTKLKALCISAFAGAVLVAGAVGLGAQQLAPPPGQPAANATLDVYTAVDAGPLNVKAVADAERIAALAREAQRLQEAGDAAGAMKKLQEL